RTAPVEIREKLTFSENTLAEAVVELKNQKSILENVIISTCNRTEIYAVVDQLHTGRYYIKRFLSDWFQIPMEEFSKYLIITEDDGAVEHLFRLSTGLDSMVLGETQILGQVRDAFLTSQNVKTTGTIFNELFKQAITFAKKAHHHTGIGEHAVSISYAAVELAKEIFGSLQNKHVAILGAGKMGGLAAKNLQGSGASYITVINRAKEKAVELAKQFHATARSLDELEEVLGAGKKGELAAKRLEGCGASYITVINRTKEQAVELAKQFHATARSLDELEEVLLDADSLISSTGSDTFVVTKEMLHSVRERRNGSPLFLVDIAVPRDIDPEVREIEKVFLYDIDDLQNIVDSNLEERKRAAEKIEFMLEEEIITF